MLGTVAGGEDPEPGRPENNWVQCLADDLRGIQATDVSTESLPLSFGVDTVLRPRAAKTSGKRYWGSSKRRTVSWRSTTGTGRREADCATQLKTPKTATRGGGHPC